MSSPETEPACLPIAVMRVIAESCPRSSQSWMRERQNFTCKRNSRRQNVTIIRLTERVMSCARRTIDYSDALSISMRKKRLLCANIKLERFQPRKISFRMQRLLKEISCLDRNLSRWDLKFRTRKN